MDGLLVLADDLSGAAESAAALRLRGSRRTGPVHVGFWPTDVPAGDTVLDLHSRHLSPADAERRIHEVLAAAPDHTVVAKIDSLLRGNLVPVVRALPGPVVLAPALPVAGRTVVGGRVLVDGNPLSTTTAWATEGRPAPATVADALPGLRTTTVPLDVVRSPGLTARIAHTPPGHGRRLRRRDRRRPRPHRHRVARVLARRLGRAGRGGGPGPPV